MCSCRTSSIPYSEAGNYHFQQGRNRNTNRTTVAYSSEGKQVRVVVVAPFMWMNMAWLVWHVITYRLVYAGSMWIDELQAADLSLSIV